MSLLTQMAWAQGEVAGAPLRLVVPYPAGGSVDFIARLLAEPLQRQLGRPVLVDNVSGAAGAIGLQRLLVDSEHDFQLAIGTDSDSILVPLLNPAVRYRPGEFRLLGTLSLAPMVLVGSPVLPIGGSGGLIELLAHARLPGASALSFGSYGVGSNSQLVAEDFARQVGGLRHVHLPYRGMAPLMQDLLGGHVDLAFLPLSGNVLDMLRGGKLRPMGIAATQRHGQLPAMPTLGEVIGGPQPFVHQSWSAVMVSRRLPEATVARLHAAVQAVLQSPDFRAGLVASGSQAAQAMGLAEAQQFLEREVARYRPLAAALPAEGGSEVGR